MVLIYFLNEGILVCFFWTAFLSVASFPPYLCLLWNVPIAVYTDSRVWIGSVTLHCAFTSVYWPYHLWKQNTESLNVYRLKSPTHHSFSFLHTFSLFMTRSLHLNVVWYMYSGLLMYCWNVCSFDKVQFILWLMCSIKCSWRRSQTCDFCSSVCSATLYTTTWKHTVLFFSIRQMKTWTFNSEFLPLKILIYVNAVWFLNICYTFRDVLICVLTGAVSLTSAAIFL